MADQNEIPAEPNENVIAGSTTPPMQIMTGVDALWNGDHREFAKMLLADAIEKLPSGIPMVPTLAAAFADAMALERQRRGGVRADDLRSQITEALDQLPAILAGLEQFLLMVRKLERKKDDEGDG